MRDEECYGRATINLGDLGLSNVIGVLQDKGYVLQHEGDMGFVYASKDRVAILKDEGRQGGVQQISIKIG